MTGQVMLAMMRYFDGDVKRTNHFLKVYGFAKAIASGEELDSATQEIIEIAALTHDIGIVNSERKYGSASGAYQQTEGPPEAEKLLAELGVNESVIKRVCWLIAHHHTYRNINDADYQILVEADFLVNAFEDGLSAQAIGAFRQNVFRTKTGKQLLDMLYEKFV